MSSTQFQVRFGSTGAHKWHNYEQKENAILEAAHGRGESSVEVTIGNHGTYIIDFNSWTQTAVSDPKKWRKVRIFDKSKSKPKFSPKHPAKSSSSSEPSSKPSNDPASFIVERLPYNTPSRSIGENVYALVQDPDDINPAKAMMVQRILLPNNHHSHPGKYVIPYNGKYYEHGDQGPAPDIQITKIEGVPYSIYSELVAQAQQDLMKKQMAQMAISQQPQYPISPASSGHYNNHSQAYTPGNLGNASQMAQFPPRFPSAPLGDSSIPTYGSYQLPSNTMSTNFPQHHTAADGRIGYSQFLTSHPTSPLGYAPNSDQNLLNQRGNAQHSATQAYPQQDLLASYAQPLTSTSTPLQVQTSPQTGAPVNNLYGVSSFAAPEDSSKVPSPRNK